MNMIDVLLLLICAQRPMLKEAKEYTSRGAVRVYQAVEVSVEICMRILQPVLATRLTLTANDIASIPFKTRKQ